MKSFIDVETVPTIPHFIEEVFDFIDFIIGCIVKGDEALEGHTKAQQFKFFMDSNGCSMMKYKILCSNNDWFLKEGGGIKLWQENKKGRVLWPCQEPVALSAQSMKNLDEIVKGISWFIKYLENYQMRILQEGIIGIMSICATIGVL